KMREVMERHGVEMPTPPRAFTDPEWQKRMAEMEARITTTIDVTGVAERKWRALESHASQLDGSFWMKVPVEAAAELFGRERFIRAHDTTDAAVPEDDLFAGLR